MNFWDGVFIASCFWFFVCLACLFRGITYGWNDFDISRFNWSEGFSLGFNDGYKIGVDHGKYAAQKDEEVVTDENA